MSRGLLDTLGRGLDRVIGAISPARELQRVGVRALRQAARFATSAYEGAQVDRTKSGWRTTPGSADADLDADTLAKLRERSRDRMRNDPLASATINAIVDNVVGCGFTPRLQLDAARLGISEARASELQRIGDDLWAEWGRECELTGRLGIEEVQAMTLAQALTNGDMLLAPVMVPSVGRSRFETKLELIEADRLDDPLGLVKPNLRSGVELDNLGRPVAYWVAVQHPGDASLPGAAGQPGARTFRRIPARNAAGRPNILHVYMQERPGQSRGRPHLSAVLNLFRDLDDYLETEVIGAQVAACFSVFIKKPNPLQVSLGRATADTRGKNPREEELSPGAIAYLGPGEDISTANPGRPNSNFGDFVKQVTRAIAAGCGIPYEVATRDFSGTTYSQARAALLEARRMFQRRQRWLVRTFLQPIWEMVLEEAWLKGFYPAGSDFRERMDLWTKVHWTTAGWGWVDPEKEVKAHEIALRLGVTTRSKIIAAGDGDDVESVFRQLAREKELAEELGLELPAGDTAREEPAAQRRQNEDEDQEKSEQPEEQPDEETVEASR